MPENPDNGALRELRDSVKELNRTLKEEVKSNRRFSLAFAGLALAQVLLAFSTFGTEFIPKEMLLLRIVVFIVTAGGTVYILKVFIKDSDQKKAGE